MDECKVRPCKFGGIECTRSDRARADCYICSNLRAKLSAVTRLEREWSAMVGELGRARAESERLRAELVTLRQEYDRLAEERDKAWHLVVELRQQMAAA